MVGQPFADRASGLFCVFPASKLRREMPLSVQVLLSNDKRLSHGRCPSNISVAQAWLNINKVQRKLLNHAEEELGKCFPILFHQ
jgi:hypothetical protein